MGNGERKTGNEIRMFMANYSYALLVRWKQLDRAINHGGED
jgi:hypothetical protein